MYDLNYYLILSLIVLQFIPNKINGIKDNDTLFKQNRLSCPRTMNNYLDIRIKRNSKEFSSTINEKFLKIISQKSECTPSVTLHRCNTKFVDDPKWIWRRIKEYYIPSKVIRKCNPSKLTYTWTIYDNKTGKYIGHFPGFKDKSVFIVKYYGLKTGNYKLKLKVSEIAEGKNSGSVSAYCLVRIRPEDPIPIIRGGSKRTVPSGKEFTMVGRDSINMNTAPGQIAILNYEWFCMKGPKPLCNKQIIDKINDIIVPSEKVIDGESFLFLLKVSTEDSKWFSTTQIVNVKKNAHLVYINCLKNCGLKVNSRSVTYLEAKCEDCPKEIYEWKMTPGKNNKKTDINFQTETAFGKNNARLVIKEHVLEPGDIYTFSVVYNGENSEASIDVKVTPLPEKGNCEIIPTEGKSLTTLFKITCSKFKDVEALTYHLFQRDTEVDGQGVLLATNEEGQFQLYLCAGNSATIELLIKVSTTDGLYVEQKLTPSVASIITNIPVEKQIKKLLDEYEGKETRHESVKALIAAGDSEGAIQMINILTAEARQISKTAEGYEIFKKKWKILVTANLEELPWESQDALRQVAATIKNLNWEDRNEIERDFAKTATRLCKKIAEKQIKNIMESPNKEILTEETVELSQDLLWCADTSMKANLKDLKHEDVIFNITTAYPLTFPVIPENYPNYDDVDLEYAKKLRDYQEITRNAMQTFTLTGIGISETLAPGEPVKQLDKYTNILQTMKDEAQLFPEKNLGGFNSSVRASKGLAAWKTQPAIGVVTAFEQNPFWWDLDTKNFSTHVLNVNYFIQSHKIVNLGKPIELLFDVNKTEPTLINASVSVPTDLNKWIPKMLDYNMTVHRVDVIKGAALRVEFHNLEGNDKIQVVLKFNSRPNYDDFKKPIFLWTGKNMLMSLFPKKMLKFGDAWVYIAVLPDTSMVKASEENNFTYSYSVSFITPLCVYQKKPLELWSGTGCRTGKLTTLTKLHCFCIHQSAYSGVYLNAQNKIDTLLQVHFVLGLKSSYVIFLCVCIVFGIYFIALIFLLIKKRVTKSSKEVYFLGDNIQQERYAYLVIVKTGYMYSAGTTSNIGIKVFGEKTNSGAHILNYPDPSKKLLQKGNEDWFILVTGKYLGNIKNIYLWHDSIGLRPSWNCEWILIFDLQENQEWFFDVQTWFSVLKEEIRHFSVQPSTKQVITSWRYKWAQKFVVSIQQEHNWNICKSFNEDDLTGIQRLTILLSVILTTYSLALIMYGTPAMRLYDGLGHGHYGLSSMTILIAFLSSLLSFLLHLALVKIFKKFSSKQQKILSSTFWPWVLLCTTIIASLTFLIIYGFWVAYVTSLLWVSSTIGALIQTVFLLENIYILIRVIITNWKSKITFSVPTVSNPSRIIEETEMQRQTFFSKFGYSLLRAYFVPKYRPLNKEEWKTKKEQELTRLKITELLQDLIMFSIYIILLYIVVLANKDHLNIYSNNEMKYIIHGEHTRTMNFKDIQNLDDFYAYINETFIPNIHSTNWYGVYEIAEPGLMADFNIKILGVARFRQLRVCNNCCEIPSRIGNLSNNCLPEFSSWYSDTREYMEYWKPKLYTAVPRLISAWKYQYDAMSSTGEIGIYSGGGYSGPLGRTLYNSYYNLKYYQDTDWIDKRSRVMHVEFLTYNANYNIFHAVKLVVEQSASGLFIKTYSICTTRLIFVKMELEIMIFVTFAAFIIMIFIMLIKNLYIATKTWRTYFKEPWNIVDIIIIIISFICIGIYIHREYLVGDFLHQLEKKKHNIFISYFNLIYTEEAFTLLASILICVATIRLWKLLRFGVIFKIMEMTLTLSARPLIAVGISHAIIILMYAFSGCILFGTESRDFRYFTSTLTTLILLSLNLYGDFDYSYLQESQGGIGYFYYITYMLISMTIFTLYVAVIVLSYGESGNYYSKLKEYYTVQKYIRDESKYYKELIQQRVKNIRLSGGGEKLDNLIQKKVTPKSQEHRYADSVVTSTYNIFVMSLVARCVILRSLKSKERFSNAETDLMRRTVYHLTTKENVPEINSIAFKSFDEGKNMKLVSDNRILKMEYVVNYILDEGTIKNLKIDPFEDNFKEMVIHEDSTHLQIDYFQGILKSILNVFNNINVNIPDNG